MIKGAQIYLRLLTRDDVEPGYIQWMNDPEIMRFLESRFKAWSVEELGDYIDQCVENKNDHFFGIFDSETDKHIGNIKLGPVNAHHKFASIGLMIGDKDFWGKGMATEAINLITEFAFKDLKLNKVTAGAYANNIGSIKAFEKCGFRREGILERHYLDCGEYVDAVLLGKLNDK